MKRTENENGTFNLEEVTLDEMQQIIAASMFVVGLNIPDLDYKDDRFNPDVLCELLEPKIHEVWINKDGSLGVWVDLIKAK